MTIYQAVMWPVFNNAPDLFSKTREQETNFLFMPSSCALFPKYTATSRPPDFTPTLALYSYLCVFDTISHNGSCSFFFGCKVEILRNEKVYIVNIGVHT